MKNQDYETFKKDNTKAGKSKLKDLINTYIQINNKIKSESAIELSAVKNQIKETYLKEIYFTLIDEKDDPVKFNIQEGKKEYFIPVFTDIEEYNDGHEKISKLFLDKLSRKTLTPSDIRQIATEDEMFKGIIINPNSQNFSFDLDNL